MSWKPRKFTLVAFAILCVVVLPSCGRDQELTGITIQPATETFGDSNTPVNLDAGLNVQLRALGTYIHPPVTKDITGQVTWAANDTQMVTVTPGGLLTATGLVCGNSLVAATVTTNKVGTLSSSGAIITGYMTANVVCFTGGGGGSGPILTVNFAGTGSGTVTSSPVGLGCASTCSTSFPTGTTVTLTAVGTNGSTPTWTGCDVGSGQVCIVNNLTANRAVTVAFN
jgi:hypothetical protein